MSEPVDTEQRIFEAARDVFHEQGYDGARMQEIAERAGINKAMLHYYYRSKDKLFEAVFRVAALKVIPKVVDIVKGEMSIDDKLTAVVAAYIDLLRSNPHLPGFVIQELRRNPTSLRKFIGAQARGAFEHLAKDIDEAIARGEIRPIAAEHLLTNVIALCVFPFIARPMLETASGMDAAAFDAFLEERREEVAKFIRDALRP